MSANKILLLHPGEMGAAVGIRLREAGHAVYWVSQGRSPDTVERARQASLIDCGTLTEGLANCEIVLSVCPPHGALALAQEVADSGFRGHYVDANAIAPRTSRQVADIVSAGGAHFTDGGIIGPAPVDGAQCRFYLSGANAEKLQPLLNIPPLHVVALPGEAGAASALKMCFSGWNKARIGLLINLRTLAHAHGVESALFDEWEKMDPAVMRYFDESAPGPTVMGTARKAWRWSPEMTEIADTFADAGLPNGYHVAAADVFDRLASFKDRADTPTFEELAARMQRK